MLDAKAQNFVENQSELYLEKEPASVFNFCFAHRQNTHE